MYERREVEWLLPTLWDPDAAYGLRAPFQPDAAEVAKPGLGVPKASKNKSHGNTLYAQLADMRAAWHWAHRQHGVPQVERQALVLRYGFDMGVEEIGVVLGVHKATISRRVERAVGRMTAWLNGVQYVDGYDGVVDVGT